MSEAIVYSPYGREVNHSLHLATRLKMSEAIVYSPYVPLWHGQGQVYTFNKV